MTTTMKMTMRAMMVMIMTVLSVPYYKALIAANHNAYSKSTKTVHPRNHKRGNISFCSPSKTYVELKYLKLTLKQNFALLGLYAV